MNRIDLVNIIYYSDGCGTISPGLAKRVTKFYWGNQQKKDKEIPSVFQIRFGGCKVGRIFFFSC